MRKLRAPVGRAAHAERGGLAGHVVTVARGGDRVQAHRVRLAVLRVDARRDHAGRLALPVRHLAKVVDDDVARLARGLRADDALRGDDLAGVGRLVLVRVDRHARLVGVRRRLEEVLVAAGGGRRRGEGRPVEGASTGQRDGRRSSFRLASGTRCAVWTSRDQALDQAGAAKALRSAQALRSCGMQEGCLKRLRRRTPSSQRPSTRRAHAPPWAPARSAHSQRQQQRAKAWDRSDDLPKRCDQDADFRVFSRRAVLGEGCKDGNRHTCTEVCLGETARPHVRHDDWLQLLAGHGLTAGARGRASESCRRKSASKVMYSSSLQLKSERNLLTYV